MEEADGEATFREDPLESPTGGLSRPRILEDGPVLERAGVMFSHTVGEDMPAAASKRRPELDIRILKWDTGMMYSIGRGETKVTSGQNGVTENMLHFATHV